MVCGLTFRGQESGSGFSAALCKIQAGKHFIKFFPIVLKDKKKAASLKLKGPLYSCLPIVHLPSASRTLN